MTRYCSGCKSFNQSFPLLPADAKNCLRCRERNAARRVRERKVQVAAASFVLDLPSFLPFGEPADRAVSLCWGVGVAA